MVLFQITENERQGEFSKKVRGNNTLHVDEQGLIFRTQQARREQNL